MTGRKFSPIPKVYSCTHIFEKLLGPSDFQVIKDSPKGKEMFAQRARKYNRLMSAVIEFSTEWRKAENVRQGRF